MFNAAYNDYFCVFKNRFEIYPGDDKSLSFKIYIIFFFKNIFLYSPSDVSPSSVGDAVSLCWLSSGDVLLLFSLQLKNRLG